MQQVELGQNNEGGGEEETKYEQDYLNNEEGMDQLVQDDDNYDVSPNQEGNHYNNQPPPDINQFSGDDNQQQPQFLQFSDEEIQHFQEIFSLFDKNQQGLIHISDLSSIMQSLQRDPNEAKSLLVQFRQGNQQIDEPEFINFQEFLRLMENIESKLAQADQNKTGQTANMNASGGLVNIQADTKVMDFLRLLEEYRKKCEQEGNYQEAKKAGAKFDELLRKETIRQRNNIRAAQEQELQNIEAAQKAQFLEFSQAWDNYMSDYEATAYLSLEKLKEKHMHEFQQFQEKIRKELKQKQKFSKDLIELRDRESKLVRMKRYDEAERIKMKGDLLEEFEKSKLDTEMMGMVEKKEAKMRHSQQLALAALLKRIQRDRNEQLKHRQQDSQRLIQRNKIILNDTLQKQNNETKRTLDQLKSALTLTRLDSAQSQRRQ